MGRKRSFLGFFVSLFVLVFSANAFAESYVCDLVYDECNAGYYLNDSSQCVPCPTGTGWASTTQAHNTASACDCPEGYWNSTTHESTVKSGETCVVSAVTVTINKNGGTGSLEAITVSGDAPTVATNSGTSNATVTCTPGAVFRLGGISRVGYTLDGFSENQNATSGTEAIQCPSSTTTFYAIWDDCEAGHYCDEDGDHTCPADYPYSDTGSDEESDCYRECTEGDIPNATSYTEDSKFYYGDEAPSQCMAADCEDGYTPGEGGICEANTIQLTYNNGGHGTAPTSPSSCTYGESFNMPAAITADGYLFKKWSVNNKTFNAGASVVCNKANLGVDSGTATITATWDDCQTGHYCDEDGDHTCPTGYTSDKNSDDIHDCYRACTTGDIPHATSYTSDSRFYYGDTAPSQCMAADCEDGYTPGEGGTCEANTIQLTYNNGGHGTAPTSPSSCTYGESFNMPAAITADGYLFKKWSVNNKTFNAGASVVCNKANLGVDSGTATITATWDDCQTGHYCDEDGDHTCPAGYTSDKNSDDIHDCYRACTTGDIPNATSYTSDSRFYYGDTAPSQCKAAGCESGYDGDNCDPADGTKYYVCHYIKEVGKSTYMFCPKGSLSDGCTSDSIVEQLVLPDAGPDRIQWLMTNCEQRTGVTGANTPAFTTLAKSMPGFTYTKGCANETSNTITGVTNAACSSVTSTTILAGDTRIVFLFYNRDKYNVYLDKDTGVSSVSGAGEYDYEVPVTIDATVKGGYKWSKWVKTSDDQTVSTTKRYQFNMPASNLNYKATTSDCEAGHYCDEDGDHTCPAGYTSDKNSDDIHDCYRECTEGDIPNATSYTSDSRFYYDDEAPSQCVAESCESGYEGEDCHEASGITYKVCHYTKNVGASTYALYNNACENKTGTSNATITLANLKKTITGFTYDAGFAGTSTNGTTKPSSGAVTTTTVLPDGSRVIDLYYNRNTYTLTLTKGTGIDSVTGAGTKEYGASVTIDATLTTNYTWSNWTNNNSNDAVVSATKNYTFTMPNSNVSYRANAVLGSRNCVAGYKDEQGQQPCDDGYYCPGGTVAASQSCQQPCPERPQGAKDLTTTGDRTAITQCQVTLTCVDAFNSNHELTGGGDKVCKYVDADRGYDNCIDVVVKYCLAGYYHDAVDTPFCTEVPVGSWSPDRAVANSCDNDPASKGMYSCDVLVNGVSATTAGKASGSPTACYTSCPTVPVTDGTGATIGTLRPDTETKNFSGTVTYSSTEPVTVVSVNGSYPACTYNNNEADCVNGYHANGTSCDPNIYKFILDKNGGTGGTDGPIYMKYNDGWYSNASATAASRITSITLPNKDEQNCSGYDMGAMTVINADGTITALPTIVNYADATTTTTLVAGWGDKQKTHCDPGYYYSAETDSCEECLPGSYCPGGDAFSGEDNDGDDLIFDCPTPAASNYTPAQSWSATTGLSNVLPQMSSDRGRTSISDCFATVRYDAIQGAGSQKCYYDATNETYDSSDCVANSITILTCNGGHHYNASETTIDCVPVGKGYYSIEYDPSRTRCPQAETYGDNITTNGTTSDSVGLCIHDNFWESKQNDANVNGAYIKRCFWNSDDSEYNINCGQSYRMRKCKAGYYDPHEGEATYAADARCIAVEDGNWSPGPANWNAVTEPDASIQINACPATSAYAGTVANDIDSTKTNPATGTRTASAISQCYLNCITEKTSGGITYTVTNSPVYYNGTKYPLCEYESDEISCSTMTNGQYPKPASGATDINQCYRDCTAADVDSNARTWTGKVMYGNVNQCTVTKCEEGYYLENGACVVCPAGNYCDGEDKTKCPTSHPNSDTGNTSIDLCYKDCVATSPVATVSGRDYYGATDTCVATSCIDGYYLQNGACVVCPAGSYCDTDGKHQCPTGYTSATGSDQKTDCYQDCEPYDIGNCHLTPVGGDRAFWPNQCEYTATINGNPATIEDGVCVPTGCLPGYELIDGECEPCDRENALSYKEGDSCTVESCVIGFHPNGDQCEPDILECTPQAPHASYAEQKWNASRNAWGICTIKSCIEGYHLASNSCVADEQVCEIENGAGMKTWNPTTNSWGPCLATSCAPGYTSDPYLKNNASQQCSECRNKFSILGEAAADAWFDGDEDCIIASCIYQGEKYNLDNNECVPICDRPYSDETGSLMWNAFTHKCDRICNPGYVSW